MGINTTQNRDLPYADSGTPMHEAFQQAMELIEKGLLIYVAAFGEAVSEFDPICILDSDDEAYICDGNDKLKVVMVGIAFDDYAEDSDGFIYGPGCLVDATGETWTRGVNIYVADDKSLSQTAGTYTIPVGIPITDTVFVVTSGNSLFQDTHIADTAAVAGVTATTPGTGADATTWTGAQCTAAYNDLIAHKNNLDALNATQDLLLAAMEKSGLLDDGT